MHWQDSNAHFDIVDTVERTERERQDIVRCFAFGSCSGPCAQGRQKCPTPDACQRSEDDESSSGTSLLVGGALALAVLGCLALIAQCGVHL